ncbi:MAG: stage III sporulation protein AE [Limnochordales bacterium]|nr:stage III sporulation protein AE [Bacillota bacterium]
MARGRILLLVWVLVLWAWDGPGAAASPQAGSDRLLREAVEEQLRLLDTRALDELLAGLDDDIRRRLPAAGLRDVLLDPQGGLRLNPVELGLEMLRYLLQEVLVQSRLLGQLVVLAVLCGLLHNLAGSLSKAATEFGFLAAYLVVIFIGLQSFSLAADIGRGTLATMSGFMLSLLPLLSTMLAAVGAVSSAALFHPMLVTSVTLVVNLIERVVFPLLFLAAALGVVGRIATEFPLTRIAGLFRQGAVTALGFFFTLFLGVMVIRGAIAPVADGVALRAGKFLAGAFIPVVGGMMADAMEVVMGGSLLIKNAIGVFGMATLLILLAFPLLKIFALVVIYRVATVLVEPISDARLVDALGTMAQTLMLVMAAVATAALMFFIVITVVVGIGNLAAVVR